MALTSQKSLQGPAITTTPATPEPPVSEHSVETIVSRTIPVRDSSSSGPLPSHPQTIIPARTSSTGFASAAGAPVFDTPLGLVGPNSPPRRKSSRRTVSVSSGDWFAGGKRSRAVSGADTEGELQEKPPVKRELRKQASSGISWMEFATSGSKGRAGSIAEGRINGVNGTSGPSKDTTSPGVSAPLTIPPPLDPPLDFGDELIFSTNPSKTWTSKKEKILLGPFDYMYGHPGKDIRAQLIGAFNAWLQVPEESLKVVTKVVGMLHTASLL